jgi:hypothetical protein
MHFVKSGNPTSDKISRTNVIISFFKMRYTKDDDGRINNFAVEPKTYEAEPPNPQQQRNYIILGVVAAALVAGLIAISVAVS